NQVVRVVHAAAVQPSGDPPEPLPLIPFAYLESMFYDANDNIILRSIEDRGDTSDTGGSVGTIHQNNNLDLQIETAEGVDVTRSLITRYRYDANGNPVLEIQPEGNATSSRYDERDLPFQRTRGATSPPLGTLGAPAGPFGPRGGEPSTVTYNYDG